MSEVEWRAVPGYEGLYEVSSEGDIRGVRRKGSKGGLLSPALGTTGRLFIQLCRDGRPKVTYVHRVVALAFYGPLPQGMETRHLDGNALNNRADNLRYGTHAENIEDMFRHGTNKSAKPTCALGHLLNEENVRVMSDNRRVCKPCARRRNVEYRARLRARAQNPVDVADD